MTLLFVIERTEGRRAVFCESAGEGHEVIILSFPATVFVIRYSVFMTLM